MSSIVKHVLSQDTQAQVNVTVKNMSVEFTGMANEQTIRRLEACLKVIELQLPVIEVLDYRLQRQTSSRKLRYLSQMLHAYAKDNSGTFPDKLSMLYEYDSEGNLPWLVENCMYLGQGKFRWDPAKTPLAYDKSLLEKSKGTNVLFLDAYDGYIKPEELRKLVIPLKSLRATR